MQKKQKLLERLDAIGAVLKDSGTALARLGWDRLGLKPRDWMTLLIWISL